ncbi:putative nicotinamide mononucleotide adenylyltransferase [Cyphellophora attinorum]|uniref:Putative nicotinamide mononucleotide adenylyltransferase n=1 Tax=Cyphellophora attinorum TaxID=1664694 RepID=A0A0N1H2L7_9EURO|nr:putative nicotinamide mononucleotide adenylyltransferase [Phialophora attinorum]KPI38770.1 putative nicotinamide mononucleotide adenylyltransferase [Phialophora attinorum]
MSKPSDSSNNTYSNFQTSDIMPSTQKLHKQFSQLLLEFSKAPRETFRIIYTHPPPTSSDIPPTDTNSHPRHRCQKLFVLDSSFNPPSRAHLGVAKAAVIDSIKHHRPTSGRTSTTQSSSSDGRSSQGDFPEQRLILLLATENADKAPKPADFADRLVMMVLMAQDLRRQLLQLDRNDADTDASGNNSSGQQPSKGAATDAAASDGARPPVSDEKSPYAIPIDIAITKKPYFMDKAASISSSGIYYSRQPNLTTTSADSPVEQTHLTGFDTLTRIFHPKYYPPDHTLSALQPFLSHHRIRALMRTGRGREAEDLQVKREDGEKEWISGKGFEKEWLEKVELVDDEELEGENVRGVSSTLVREAVGKGDWEGVRGLCGEEIAEWVRERALYTKTAEEAKGNRDGGGGGQEKL